MEGSNKFAGCRAQVPQAQRPPCQCFFLILRPLLRAQASRASAAQHPNRYGTSAVGGRRRNYGFARTRRLVETRAWTRNFTGCTPSTRQGSPPQGARAIDGKLRRQGRRPRAPAPEQTKTPRPTLTPPPNKTRRPTAVPEQYHLRTSPDFVDPPAATAAAAAFLVQEAAAAPVPG